MEKVIPQNFKAPYEKHFTFKTKQNFYDAVHDMFGTKTENLENCSDYILSATTKALEGSAAVKRMGVNIKNASFQKHRCNIFLIKNFQLSLFYQILCKKTRDFSKK